MTKVAVFPSASRQIRQEQGERSPSAWSGSTEFGRVCCSESQVRVARWPAPSHAMSGGPSVHVSGLITHRRSFTSRFVQQLKGVGHGSDNAVVHLPIALAGAAHELPLPIAPLFVEDVLGDDVANLAFRADDHRRAAEEIERALRSAHAAALRHLGRRDRRRSGHPARSRRELRIDCTRGRETVSPPSAGSPVRAKPNCLRLCGQPSTAPSAMRLSSQLPGTGWACGIAFKLEMREIELGNIFHRKLGGLPAQAFLGKAGDIRRVDAALPKGVDQCLAIGPAVVRDQIVVRRDQRAQVFAEIEIDRRAVVDRADADGEEVAGELAGLIAEDVLQVDRQLAFGKAAGAARGEAHVLRGLATEDGQRRFEYGLHENFAKLVRFHAWAILLRLALRGALEGGAQRLRRAERCAELMRDAGEQARAFDLALRAADRRLHHLAIAEVLKRRDEIGKAFVKAEHVRAGRLGEMRAQAVEQRVGYFVRDDIVGEAGENDAARQRAATNIFRRWEISEAELTRRPVVVGVLVLEGVRPDAQPARGWSRPRHARQSPR